MKYYSFIILINISLVFCEPFDGMTLFTVNDTLGNNFKTLLLKNDSQVVNEWNFNTSPASSAYLMKDSTLLYPTNVSNPPFQVAASGGRILLFSWDGSILWDYYYFSENYIQHHDIEPLPNGNILLLCYEVKSFEEAINKGFQGITGEVWSEKIVEISPSDNNSAEIIWEWHLWDHLIQDVNTTLPNYGIISENPGKFNVNAVEVAGFNGQIYSGDWLHANSIFYNSTLNQIALSCRRSCEFYVIDHTTSTLEASSNHGGHYGKGGDFIYRWGNPQMYGRGNESDKQLFHQHCVNWISSGYPGDGNFIIFNNGTIGSGGNGISSIVEIIPPYLENGGYLEDQFNAYGPSFPLWTYDANGLFNSGLQSSAFRLENGNTFVTVTNGGGIYEIDTDNQIVWSYENVFQSNITRAFKYGLNYLSSLNGDINQDGIINVIDVVYLVNIVIGELELNSNSDLNLDGFINVIDIIILINLIIYY